MNLDALRKQVANLTDEALLEVSPEDLTEEAKAIYDAELAARNLTWPSAPEDALEATLKTAFPEGNPEELVQVARYVAFDEARFALNLLRHENIPVWLAGATSPNKIAIDPNGPFDLLTNPEFLEAAQLLLSTEISEEELARMAEEAGEAPE